MYQLQSTISNTQIWQEKFEMCNRSELIELSNWCIHHHSKGQYNPLASPRKKGTFPPFVHRLSLD